jgi:hypothetical protein
MDCPARGSPVTLEVGREQPLWALLSDAVLAAEKDEYIEVAQVRWNCGWHGMRRIRVESIDTIAGDEATVKRVALIDEITDELADIDQVATFEGLLAETRRQRGIDPAATDGDNDATE